MSAAIHVEYLSGYLSCVCQVENSLDNVLYLHDFPHRLKCLKKVLGIILVQWCVDGAGSHRVEADAFLCVLDCETSRPVFRPPLVIIETEALRPAMGLSASEPEMVTTFPDFCFSICFTVS